jgi:hypothetical protein
MLSSREAKDHGTDHGDQYLSGDAVSTYAASKRELSIGLLPDLTLHNVRLRCCASVDG